jgi:hypothetical protein
MLAQPRLFPPRDLNVVVDRLAQIPKTTDENCDLGMFYHPDTEAEIRTLRLWFLRRSEIGTLDEVDAWIRMVATNRLTGHSPGFFSVYTLPPNQALTREKQLEINLKRNQIPEYRDTHALILKKSRQLLKNLSDTERENLYITSKTARFYTCDARYTDRIISNSISLTVTSPPFLNVVQYKKDNWLRCWFCGLDVETIGKQITMATTVNAWSSVMSEVLAELYRIKKPGAYLAFEVGEIRKGSLKLEEIILPLGLEVGFTPLGIIINEQKFTKTANIWGVENNKKGTNSNRIVLFRK